MKTFGIDISKWQGNFNLELAQKEGVKFAILKAGGSDSGRYKDKKFESFYADCKKLNIPVGAYYFGNDKTVVNAIKSAEHFVTLLNNKQFDLPVYYDVEGAMLNINKTLLTSIVKAFCDTVAKYGYKVGIYTSQSVFNTKIDDKQLKNYSHWVARWSKTEPKSLNSGANIDIWQFGGSTNYIRSNKVAGVVCDQDYCYLKYGVNNGNNGKENTEILPKNITSYGIGVVKCPEGISGSINFDLLDYSQVFDVKFYKLKYKDLTDNGLKTDSEFEYHFKSIGMLEGRSGCKEFNPIEYKKYNPDLAGLFGNDWKWYYAHYICTGRKEGRKCK